MTPHPAAPFRLLMRLPVPWVFVLGYLLGAAAQPVWQIRLGHAQSAGLATFAAGAALAAWGWFTFLKARTTTVPGKASAALVTWGPYRFTRNPMYVGLTVAYVGEALLLGQVWPLFVLPAVVAYVNWVVIPVEEARLTEVFGDRYIAYRSRVRRWV
ncbi:MAG TPA: isoprenylcysteine carboxylmethyltransferase family protein [Vicinamibacterales bacterium]|jgi:protein-S-isoprenylcysteine O-methyltransferase Ste14|nr:isoprenylcysteine carboxylmethyltransferase family protein [Vicinamibacterales bacterium]